MVEDTDMIGTMKCKKTNFAGPFPFSTTDSYMRHKKNFPQAH